MSQLLCGFGFYLPRVPYCCCSSAGAVWVRLHRSPAEVLSGCQVSLLLWCSASSLEHKKIKIMKKKSLGMQCTSWGELAKLL